MAKKQSKKSNVTPIKRTPKDEPLPGMEQVKSRRLSKTCGTLADVRAQINDLKQTEKGLLGTALAQMRAEDVTSYTDHGVELIRTSQEKVRVRLVDDDTDTDAEQGDLGAAAFPQDATHHQEGADDAPMGDEPF